MLKLEDLLFGDAVSLGGFISVTPLIVVLLVSRAGVRRLGEDSPRELTLQLRERSDSHSHSRWADHLRSSAALGDRIPVIFGDDVLFG